jgi:hypothetical protein
LTGCGGGTGASPQIQPSNPNPNCSIKIEALKPPTPGGGSWNEFQAYVLSSPAVHGVDIYTPWNSVETSQGVYDFSSLDAQLADYPGKAINLIWQPISYSNINDSQGGFNTMTPSYVFTSQWASSLNPPASPLDVVTCPESGYPGNGTYTSGYPVVYEAPFRVAYQNFITAVLQHYQGNTTIGYMRFGLSVGDEADAYCTAEMQNPALVPSPNTFAADPSPSTWENWIQTMDAYEKSQLSDPPIQLMESLNSLDTTSGPTVLPDFEAATAVSNGFGFGSNGWENSDIAASASNTPCTSDWCAMFDQYAGQVPLELQTATPSDPSDPVNKQTNPTGNLALLIPLAAQHHATILELALSDLYLALDPNYTPANPAYSSYASAYQAAITNPCGQ